MTRYKYPKTLHLPGSNCTDDDKFTTLDPFIGVPIVITEKMDGENTTLYSDGYVHARSVDGKSHPSQSWVRNWWSSKVAQILTIDKDYRVCGENLYAKHGIFYEDLPDYFLGFSVWEGSRCCPWEFTQQYFKTYGIQSVPVLMQGTFQTHAEFRRFIDLKSCGVKEGFVIRVQDPFHIDDFQQNVAKYVLPDFKKSSQTWNGQIQKNKIAKQSD